MAGTFLQSLLHGLRVAAGQILAHAWAIIAIGAIVAGVLVALYAIDRDRVLGWWSGLRLSSSKGFGWLAVISITSFGMYVLTIVQRTVVERSEWKRASPYSDQEVLSYGDVFQQGPVSSYVQEKTFTRRLTLPKDFVDRLGGEGVAALAPYLGDPSSSNVLGLEDQFVRSGDNVVFTRDVRRLEETPVMLSQANVDVKFEVSSGGLGSQSLFTNEFSGEYRFQNPLPTPVQARFTFPLPSNQTAITGFELKVNGQAVAEPDQYGNYTWQGELAPNAEAVATIRYKVKGSGNWSFSIASNRRRIAKFHLNVTSDRLPKLVKNALYPNTRSGNSYTWDLENAISDQNVNLHFEKQAVDEFTFEKAMSFAPAALALLVFGCFVWSRLFGLSLSAAGLGFASIGAFVGFGIAAVFIGYAAGWVSLLLGSAIATILAIRALGSAFAIPIVIAAASTLAFLTERHAGLAIGLAVVLLLVIGLNRLHPRRQNLPLE